MYGSHEHMLRQRFYHIITLAAFELGSVTLFANAYSIVEYVHSFFKAP